MAMAANFRLFWQRIKNRVSIAATVGVERCRPHGAAMSIPSFKHLNGDWNAEPNAPEAEVAVNGTTVRLTFFLNPWAYQAVEEERGSLAFSQCSLWRLGSTNDEGWDAGQCRYSKSAPRWGEFYELFGEDDQRFTPTDWHELMPISPEQRHFLFYLRDNTFECFAAEWRFERNGLSHMSPRLNGSST
jgi:hypothetical protein